MLFKKLSKRTQNHHSRHSARSVAAPPATLKFRKTLIKKLKKERSRSTRNIKVQQDFNKKNKKRSVAAPPATLKFRKTLIKKTKEGAQPLHTQKYKKILIKTFSFPFFLLIFQRQAQSLSFFFIIMFFYVNIIYI